MNNTLTVEQIAELEKELRIKCMKKHFTKKALLKLSTKEQLAMAKRYAALPCDNQPFLLMCMLDCMLERKGIFRYEMKRGNIVYRKRTGE